MIVPTNRRPPVSLVAPKSAPKRREGAQLFSSECPSLSLTELTHSVLMRPTTTTTYTLAGVLFGLVWFEAPHENKIFARELHCSEEAAQKVMVALEQI